MLAGSQLPDVLRCASHSARLDRLSQFLVGKGGTVGAMYNVNQVVQSNAERLCGQFRLPAQGCRVPLHARRALHACWYSLLPPLIAIANSPSRLAETVDRTILWLGRLRRM